MSAETNVLLDVSAEHNNDFIAAETKWSTILSAENILNRHNLSVVICPSKLSAETNVLLDVSAEQQKDNIAAETKWSTILSAENILNRQNLSVVR